MVQIGELVYKTRFDGSALSRGLLSTRQQMKFARNEIESMKDPAKNYADSMTNINSIIARYPQLEGNRLKYMQQAKLAFLEQSEAVRKLTQEEKRRMDLLRAGMGVKPPSVDKESTGFAAALSPRALATGAAAGIVGKSLAAAADAQRSENLLTAMTQSRVQAKGLIEDMRNLSQASGIKMTGLQDSAKVMLGFGVETRKIVPILTRLGDIAGGDTERMKGLALAFSQVAALGRLTAEETNQMVERGFNPLSEMSRVTGESMVSLRKRMQEGRVSFAEFEAAVVSATSAGGRFYGAAAAGNAGLAGAFSKISNEVEMLSTKFGTALAPAAETIAKALSAGLPILDQYIDGVGRLASGFSDAAGAMASMVPKSVADAGGSALSMVGNPIMSALGTVPDVVTGFTSRDELKNNEANDRLRKRFGRGIFHEDRNKEIDAFFKTRADNQAAEEAKKSAAAKEKELYAQAEMAKKQKEIDRTNAASALNKGLSDRMTVERWNLDNPRAKASSAAEVETIKSMNAAERTRLEILQSQSELVEKMKDDEESLKKIIDRGNSMGQSSQLDYYRNQLAQADKRDAEAKTRKEGDAMRERNMTAAERFSKQLSEVDRLKGTGAIDAITAMREKMAIQTQMQQQLAQQQTVAPGMVASQSSSSARSISSGSVEAAQYMDDLKAMISGDGQKNEPQTKQLEQLNEQLKDELIEMKQQTILLKDIASQKIKMAR